MFKRTYSFLFAGKRKLIAAPLLLLFFAGTAFAAWVVFSGASGSGQGSFASATQQTAITIAGTNQPALAPGASTPLQVSLTNNDPNNAHTLSGFTATFTAVPSNCASFLSEGPDSISGQSVPAGGTTNGTVMINLASNAPVSCANGSWSISFTGTTSP